MFGFTTLVVVAVVVVLFMFFVATDAGRSWWHLIRTKIGLSGEYAKGLDPASQMQQAARDAATDLQQADEAMIKSESLRLALQRQIETEKRQLETAKARLAKALKNGDPTSKTVVDLAKQIRDLEKNISENEEQARIQTQLYNGILESAKRASGKIAATMAEASRLKVQLQVSEETAKLQKIIQQYDPSTIDNKLSNMDVYRQAANQKIDENTAAMKVMADRATKQYDDDNETIDDELQKIIDAASKKS